jgi:hypothetical protein
LGLRIGDILVREGLVTAEDIEDALVLVAKQPMRLASALVVLGRLTPDAASRALAELHGVPAALARHLSGRDLALAGLVPALIAREIGALPLAVQRSDGALVVCVRDPGPATINDLEQASGHSVKIAVATDFALLPLIDETYPPDAGGSESGIPVEFDVDLDTGPATAPPPMDLDSFQLVDLDHQAVAKDVTMSHPGIRLSGLFTSVPVSASSGPLRPKRITGALLEALEPPRTLQHDPALDAIGVATTREQVVDALMAFLRHRFHAAVVFSVKDGLALGHAAFGSDTVIDAVDTLAIPLGPPSVLRNAHDRNSMVVGAPGEPSVVQDRFFKLFDGIPPTVVVVPISIDDRVINLVYAHGPRLATAEDSAAELGSVAEAAADAFVRIIRASKGS